MSRIHVAKEGDTLRKIAVLYYGSEIKNLLIRKANPQITNPDLIFPGQKITIPNIPSRQITAEAQQPEPAEIEIDPETTDQVTGLSDEVGVLIDGEVFKLWESIEIDFNFDTIGDQFTMSTPWHPEIERYRKTFQPFTRKRIALYLGGQKIMVGTMVVHNPKSTINSSTLTISGYSIAAVLSKANPSPSAWPLEFSGLDLEQIAQELADPFGIKVTVDGDIGPKFKKSDKVRMEPDQKIYDFLIKLARQRGFVISSDLNGFLLFRKTTEDPADISIFQGQPPFIDSNFSYDSDARFSDVTALSTNNKKGAGQKYTVEDPELKDNGITMPLVYKASDIEAGQLKEAATARLGRDIAASVSGSIKLEGFYDVNGKLWRDDRKIIYQSDPDMIYEETEFLIRQAKLSKKANSSESHLTLVFPEAYNGEIRSSYPWQVS